MVKPRKRDKKISNNNSTENTGDNSDCTPTLQRVNSHEIDFKDLENIDVRLMSQQNIPAATEVLRHTFLNEARFKYVEPDPEKRIDLFNFLAGSNLLRGKVENLFTLGLYANNNLIGFGSWFPPSKKKIIPWGMILKGIAVSVKVFESNHWKWLYRFLNTLNEQQKIFNSLNEKRDFWRLIMIAVDSPYQGKGLGGLFFKGILAMADRDKQPAYHISFDNKSHAFWEKLGFKLIETRKTAFTMYLWQREPQPIPASEKDAPFLGQNMIVEFNRMQQLNAQQKNLQNSSELQISSESNSPQTSTHNSTSKIDTNSEGKVEFSRTSSEGKSESSKSSSNSIQGLKNIDILKEIGSGHFGTVYLGVWLDTISVALKKLHVESSEIEFFQEAALLSSLRHPHIVNCYGMWNSADEKYIVMEYCPHGNLHRCLVDLNPMLTPQVKMKLCTEIANGMAYLAERAIVHRDLAARNVLLAENMQAKISDVGLARMTEEDYYLSSSDKIPIRWASPEAFRGKFSSKSDVFAFGVVLWEIFQDGVLPWFGYSNMEVLSAVLQGNTLPRPSAASLEMFQLMKESWAVHPDNRPTFADIVLRLPRLTEVQIKQGEAADLEDDEAYLPQEELVFSLENLDNENHLSSSSSSSSLSISRPTMVHE